MPAPPEAIARRLAANVAPDMDARLLVLVERILAEERVEEATFRSSVPEQVLAIATFLVGLSTAVWGIYMGLWQKGQAKRREEALADDVEALKRETAFLKGLLLAELRERAPRIPELTDAMRDHLLETAADEALAEPIPSSEERKPSSIST